MINIEKIKPTALFTNYIYKAIPLAFDESMSYYETLCGLLAYLKDTVIPSVNNNADAVIEVQNLIEELQNYITEKLIICVNTVNDLKNLNLKSNQMIKTLGYYEINDGGNGIYLITENIPNSYYETLNNGLYAQLIFNNNINVKQFGAYGDGNNDDTTAIQNAINYTKNYIKSKENNNELICLTIPSGTYKITNTINLSPMVKLKTNGTVIINSYCDNTCLHLLPEVNDNDQWYHYNGKYITSNDGITIINKLSTKGTTIGLELSTSSSVGNFKGFMHGIIEDITFKDFNTGIFIHSVNVYCNNFNNLKFLNTNYNVVWGDTNASSNNSGERITFKNCQFGSKETLAMILFNSDIADMNFIDCSFDYGNCVFYDLGNKGYSNINCTQCHFEGISKEMTDTQIQNMPYGIVYGDFKYSNINIFQSNIGISKRRKMFNYLTNSTPLYAKYRLNIIDCEIGTPDISYNYNELFWINEDVNAYVRNSTNHILYSIFPNIKNNIIENGYFDLATLGEITVSNNSNVGGLIVSYNPGFQDKGEIIINSITNKKCLKLKAKTNNPSIQLISNKFDVMTGDKLNVCAMTKNFYSYTVYIKYYDDNDNEISETTRTPNFATHPDKTVDSVNAYTVQDYAPYRARKATVRIAFSNSGQQDTVLIDDYCYIDSIMCYKN